MDRYTVPKIESNFSKIPTTIYESLTGKTHTDSWVPTWVWWVVGGIVSFGVIFTAFSVYKDPSIITNLFPWNRTPNVNNNVPQNGLGAPGDQPDIQINDARTHRNPIYWLYDGLTMVTGNYRAALNWFNPFHWVSGANTSDAFNNFMQDQCNPNTVNRTQFPYTLDNPHDSWFNKLRLAVFGESNSERLLRENRLSEVREAQNVFVHGTGVHTPAKPSGPFDPSAAFEKTSYLKQSVAGTGHNSPLHAPSVKDTLKNFSMENAFDEAKNPIKSTPIDPANIPADDQKAWSEHEYEKGKGPGPKNDVNPAEGSSNKSSNNQPQSPKSDVSDHQPQSHKSEVNDHQTEDDKGKNDKGKDKQEDTNKSSKQTKADRATVSLDDEEEEPQRRHPILEAFHKMISNKRALREQAPTTIFDTDTHDNSNIPHEYKNEHDKDSKFKPNIYRINGEYMQDKDLERDLTRYNDPNDSEYWSSKGTSPDHDHNSNVDKTPKEFNKSIYNYHDEFASPVDLESIKRDDSISKILDDVWADKTQDDTPESNINESKSSNEDNDK